MKVSVEALKVMVRKGGRWHAYANASKYSLRYMKCDKPPRKLPDIDGHSAGYVLAGEVNTVTGEIA